uniref:Aldehyde dehydrogenase 4 n=1 Tax=Tricholoma vaccinum TaxID=56470 RepID=A0A0N9MFZ3_9AGAR|nr:aldehyde dehydrogenase 4 [Tricholoma vaccinum]
MGDTALFVHKFDTPFYKGTVTINTGLFINGCWVDPVDKATIDIVNPTTGKVITSVAAGSSKDVDIAVEAAKKAFKTTWGLKCPGNIRGKLLSKLAELMEAQRDEFVSLEALDVGKPWHKANTKDVEISIMNIRYFAGWADKIHGQTIETNENKLAYTRHEPYGVVGQIIPWNFPLMMLTMKCAPALATGNVIVLKPSEITPLTALKFAGLVNEAGFPPGVINIINGYGNTVGEAISHHPLIDKISFTGSTLVGRKILKASAESNLKDVTLELGGKSPTIIFDDADLDQAIKWAAQGIFGNMGQICMAGSRIYVQEGIYEEFLARFTEVAEVLGTAAGDPFAPGTEHGPQASQIQFDRVMAYIDSGKKDGAKVQVGGERHGQEGYFIQPTVFTDCKPEMKMMKEEIFGPVAAVGKFKTEEEVIDIANATMYGLGCNIFTENISRGLRVAHQLEAGSAWVNFAQVASCAVPFGGYKQSGIGRELGQNAIDTYTQVKGVHVNIGLKL